MLRDPVSARGFAGSGPTLELAGANEYACKFVVRVDQCAVFDREASAADAACEVVFYPGQLTDARFEVPLPRVRKPFPFGACWGAVGGAVSAVAIWFGSRMLDGGDFTTPFFVMASAIGISSLIYWRVFRPLEISESGAAEVRELSPALAD